MHFLIFKEEEALKEGNGEKSKDISWLKRIFWN